MSHTEPGERGRGDRGPLRVGHARAGRDCRGTRRVTRAPTPDTDRGRPEVIPLGAPVGRCARCRSEAGAMPMPTPRTTRGRPGAAPRDVADPRRASRDRSRGPSDPCWPRGSSSRRAASARRSSIRSSGWRHSRTPSSTRSSGSACRLTSPLASSHAPRSSPSTSPCPGAVETTSRRSSAAQGAPWRSRTSVKRASRSTSGSRVS